MQYLKILVLTVFLGTALTPFAQDVDIRNPQNETRIKLLPQGVDDGGEMRLYDPDGTLTMDIGGNSETDQGAFVNMFRGDGVRTIHLDAHHYNGGQIYLNNADGNFGIHLLAHESIGTGSIIDMFDASGARRLKLDTDVGLFGSAQMLLYNSNGVSTIRLNTNAFSGSGFEMRDAAGNTTITMHGNPGLGGFHLSVDGNVISEEIRVMDSDDWPDYVFAPEYDLPTLDTYAASIARNGHMPGVPSAADVAEDGIDLGEMSKRQMEKIEELTLYILQLHERISELENAKQ